MERRSLSAWLVLVALAASGMARADGSAAFWQTVQPSDADAKQAFAPLTMMVGFVDANEDGQLNAQQPDETVYLDLDGDHAVSFGDIRLTAFLHYPAGSAVDFTNRDFGRALTPVRGWFAQDASGAWYLDANGDGRVSLADVRLTGAQAGTKVLAGEADVGAALTDVQGTIPPNQRALLRDANRDFRHEPGEAVYLDLNGDGQASPGEPRIVDAGLGLDNEPTRAEFNQALAQIAQLQQQNTQLAQENQALKAQQQAGDAALGLRIDGLAATLGSSTTWLLVLGLFDLVGVVCVAWYARHLHRQRAGAPAASADLQEFRR